MKQKEPDEILGKNLNVYWKYELIVFMYNWSDNKISTITQFLKVPKKNYQPPLMKNQNLEAGGPWGRAATVVCGWSDDKCSSMSSLLLSSSINASRNMFENLLATVEQGGCKSSWQTLSEGFFWWFVRNAKFLRDAKLASEQMQKLANLKVLIFLCLLGHMSCLWFIKFMVVFEDILQYGITCEGAKVMLTRGPILKQFQF